MRQFVVGRWSRELRERTGHIRLNRILCAFRFKKLGSSPLTALLLVGMSLYRRSRANYLFCILPCFIPAVTCCTRITAMESFLDLSKTISLSEAGWSSSGTLSSQRSLPLYTFFWLNTCLPSLMTRNWTRWSTLSRLSEPKYSLTHFEASPWYASCLLLLHSWQSMESTALRIESQSEVTKINTLQYIVDSEKAVADLKLDFLCSFSM